MIEYDPYFKDKVKGTARAEFVPNVGGEPDFIESGGRRNYRIRLQLIADNPEIRKVDYKLDPSYYNAYRESTDATSNFGIELTSYGDYDFIMEVIVGRELARQKLTLSDLLSETYQSPAGAFLTALNDIKAN